MELSIKIPGWRIERGQIAMTKDNQAVGVAVRADDKSDQSMVVVPFKSYQSVCDLGKGRVLNYTDGTAILGGALFLIV